ncbi:hypothetical protein [Xenorhabdus littoralis]|uniref:hypothetical protein n=1 Tax=Xenorhabdus littoralis TaxID=2582835 RepID=UPI003F6CEAFD
MRQAREIFEHYACKEDQHELQRNDAKKSLAYPPVSVWRELRRLREIRLADNKIDAVLRAADEGNWAAYTQAQGGPWVARRNLVIRLSWSSVNNCTDGQGSRTKRSVMSLVNISTKAISYSY